MTTTTEGGSAGGSGRGSAGGSGRGSAGSAAGPGSTAVLGASTTGRSVVFWARPRPAPPADRAAPGSAAAPPGDQFTGPRRLAADQARPAPSAPALSEQERLDEARLVEALMSMRRREGTPFVEGTPPAGTEMLRRPAAPAGPAGGGPPADPPADPPTVPFEVRPARPARPAAGTSAGGERPAAAAPRAGADLGLVLDDVRDPFHDWPAPRDRWASPRELAGRLPTLARAHRVLLALLVPALLLRILTVVAYRTAFEFYGDSYAYLKIARTLRPGATRPGGYPLLLALLSPTGELWVVTVVQHLAGIGIGIGVYALLTHRGLPRWLAAVGAAPVLLDAYQVVLEQFVMAETMFSALLVGAVIALTWSRRPSARSCAVAGFLLALATATRTVGVEIGVLAFLYLVARRVGGRRLLAFGGALALSLLAYALWFLSSTGEFALSGSSAPFLYGRVAPIANCARLDLTFEQSLLCSPHPASVRPDPNYYVWSLSSPLVTAGITRSQQDKVFGGFAKKVIADQPGDYARLVAGDLLHYFAPGRWVGTRDWPVGSWQFPAGHRPPTFWHVTMPLQGFSGDIEQRNSPGALGTVLHTYQRVGYLPGPGFAVAALIALGGPLAARRRRAADRSGRLDRWSHTVAPPERPAGADCVLLITVGLMLLLLPAATVCFDYRYALPLLVLFPPAAALGWHQWRGTAPVVARPVSQGPAVADPVIERERTDRTRISPAW